MRRHARRQACRLSGVGCGRKQRWHGVDTDLTIREASGVPAAHVCPHVVTALGLQSDARSGPDYAFEWVAVTLVVMPPRAAKLPITVMRRGDSAATRSSRIWFVAAS